MKTPPLASVVHAPDGTPIGIMIHARNARALRDEDENIVERWALRIARQQSAVAVAPASMGRSAR